MGLIEPYGVTITDIEYVANLCHPAAMELGHLDSYLRVKRRQSIPHQYLVCPLLKPITAPYGLLCFHDQAVALATKIGLSNYRGKALDTIRSLSMQAFTKKLLCHPEAEGLDDFDACVLQSTSERTVPRRSWSTIRYQWQVDRQEYLAAVKSRSLS